MRLNNKGFAISSIMYLILVMALILVAILLSLLNNRKMILDRQKKSIIDSVAQEDIESLTPLEINPMITIPKTGLYKVELCGAKSNSVNGSCTSGLINLSKDQILYLNISDSVDIRLNENNQSTSIMFAAGGTNKYYNNDCDGSFISGHIGCNCNNTGSPVYSGYVFSNTLINKEVNAGVASANIIYISS